MDLPPSGEVAGMAEVQEPSATDTVALHTPRCDVRPGTTYTLVLRTAQPQTGNNRDARAGQVQGSQRRVRDAVKGSG